MQWSIEALLNWAKQVSVELDATNFRNFLEILMINCPTEQNTHILRACIPDKKDVWEIISVH